MNKTFCARSCVFTQKLFPDLVFLAAYQLFAFKFAALVLEEKLTLRGTCVSSGLVPEAKFNGFRDDPA